MELNKIYNCDVIEGLKRLPDESINCVVTSPPYWNLRDYGVAGQIGLERTPENYIQKLSEVFREAMRVLRKDGTLWVNIGDSYASSGKNRTEKQAVAKSTLNGSTKSQMNILRQQSKISDGLKPKDLVGIPWMLAFALRADGWYLRQDIIWHKPNPMPESVTDRCTKSHEYIFLLSKSAKYYFDQESILENVSLNTHEHVSQNIAAQIGSSRANGGSKTNGNMKAVIRTPKQQSAGKGIKNNDSFNNACILKVEKRNRRSVWSVPTQSFKGAHFATYPEALIIPCILAGCPEGGVVLDPFFGSGTTGEAALKLNRKFIGIELNPDYIKISEMRIEPYRQIQFLNFM